MNRRVDPRVALTRSLVIGAASDLLAEEGFERVTIDGIAERSGVARSTVYRHWPDRADLLGEVFTAVCSPAEIGDLGSVEAELRELATGLATGLREEPWGQMLPSLVGAAHHDDDLRRALSRFSGERRRRALAVLRRGVERGEIDASIALDGPLERFIAPFFLRWLMTQEPIDDAFVDAQLAAISAELRLP